MWSVWGHKKDILTCQHQEVMSHGSWQRTWVSLKDRSWRSAQTNFVQALSEIIRIRLDTRAACTPLFLPCRTGQTIILAFCLNASGTGPRRANIGGRRREEVLFVSTSEKHPWGGRLPDPPALDREWGLTAFTLVNEPEKSRSGILTLPPHHKATSQPCAEPCELPACSSSPESGCRVPGLSQIKPVPTTCHSCSVIFSVKLHWGPAMSQVLCYAL